MISEKMQKQLEFLLEADKMKSLYRQTYIIADETRGVSMRDFEGDVTAYRRRENDAEHSFHLALFAMVLSEYSNEPVDLLKVMKTVLIHDIVEIDAGDTYCYDQAGNSTKREREVRAADRLFGLLPDEQRDEYRTLWEEFERGSTPEARFANVLDRLQPLMLNYAKGGVSWLEHGIREEQVRERNSRIRESSEQLWEYIDGILRDAADKGMLKP